jgi:hypothetical protein
MCNSSIKVPENFSLYFLVCMRIHQFVQSMGIVAVLISLFWKEWKFGELSFVIQCSLSIYGLVRLTI